MFDDSRWLVLARRAILILGIVLCAFVVYNMLPAWDQLRSTQSYIAAAQERGELVSPKMLEVLQRGQEQIAPFLWQLAGVAGMTVSLFFILRPRAKPRLGTPHPAAKSDLR